jgi:hypothetical protein
MSDRELRDEVLTMLLAGHETTVASIIWALLLLAAHPEALKHLRSEVDSVLNGERPRDVLGAPIGKGFVVSAAAQYYQHLLENRRPPTEHRTRNDQTSTRLVEATSY